MERRRLAAWVVCVGAVQALCPVAMAAPSPGADSSAGAVIRLIQAQGVAGSESDVTDAVSSLLPSWARPRLDELGNLIVTVGQGRPHVLVTASIDEDGFVVSRITDDGYLRLQRVTGGAEHRLFDQYHYSRPVSIRTAGGALVPGVIASTSQHLGLSQAIARGIRTLDDMWVDVGASSRAEVERLGIGILDTVAARQRVQALGNGRLVGVAAQARANAAALAAVLAGFDRAPAVTGTLTIAWTTQGTFRGRGLQRLSRTIDPDRVIVLGRSALGRDPDARGAYGRLGGGAILAVSDTAGAALAGRLGISVQTLPAVTSPTPWPAAKVEVLALPVLFAQTPTETIEPGDVDALTRLVAGLVGLEGGRAPAPDVPAAARAAGPPAASAPATARAAAPATVAPSEHAIFRTLRPLVEAYGVSPNEAPVRDVVRSLLPSWARPEVDARGNLTVSVGAGGRQLIVMAHIDEIGYQVTAVRDDGAAHVRKQGGVSDAVFEARVAVVQTARGPVPAVIAPRLNYARATDPAPAPADVCVYFGTDSRQETEALGIATGDTVTVRKTLERLAGARATGRSMDDRAGAAALLAVLGRIDRAKLRNRVVFAWTTGEETGLTGSAGLAERIRADVAVAVDTLPSSDSPVDPPRLAFAPLGSGAVIRGMDTSTIVPRKTVARLADLAKARAIRATVATTSGGTDGSSFTPTGSEVLLLSWPGRYSHSSVEVVDARDLEALVALILGVIDAW